MTDTTLGLIAGEGVLPVRVAEEAREQGYTVAAFSLFGDNAGALKPLCRSVERVSMGLVEKNLALFKERGVSNLVFAGKVNKWLMLQNLRMDATALNWLKQLTLKNDDAVMLSIIEGLELRGFRILPQVQFMRRLFKPAQVLGRYQLAEQDWKNIAFGYPIAKMMGQHDVGQTLVVKDCMVMAVEAIEGTDECLKRAGHLAKKKGGVVIKVAKPEQDNRFDVPAVGLRTLKTMRSVGLNVLATEANTTLYLDFEAMKPFADKHGIRLVSFDPGQLKAYNPLLFSHQEAASSL